MRDQEKVAKPPQLAQTGWCGQELFDHTTPSAPSKEASLLLLDVAATPPPAEEGCRRITIPGVRIEALLFIHKLQNSCKPAGSSSEIPT